MAIFNEMTTDFGLVVLNEKKTREEYARRSFKKKYNYEPSKEDPNIGTITDKKGKQYKIVTDETDILKDGSKRKRPTQARVNDADSTIDINSDIYKMKGSHKGESIKAAIEHEIGHQNLHNYNPNNKTVNSSNRNFETFRRMHSGSKINISDPKYAKQIEDYLATSTASDNDVSERLKTIRAAEKYENKKTDHASVEEFEADRYAANQTSDRAVRNMIKNVYRKQEKDLKSGKYDSSVDTKKSKEIGDIDKSQRLKALKDEEIRNGKAYK